MWNKIKDWCIEANTVQASQHDYWDGEGLTTATEEEQISKAQHLMNRALAHYCEICDIGFKHTNMAKNHKRIKHKS